MSRLSYTALLALLAVPHLAHAQQTPGGAPSTALRPPQAISETQAHPNWLVWRAFHDGLAFYAARSSAEVYSMLKQRAGLTDQEATAVLDIGDDYLRALTVIDESAAREVETRREALGGPEEIFRARSPGNSTVVDGSFVSISGRCSAMPWWRMAW